MLQDIDRPPGRFSPHPLAHYSPSLVSPAEGDQHLHNLIAGKEEEQFVCVL